VKSKANFAGKFLLNCRMTVIDVHKSTVKSNIQREILNNSRTNDLQEQRRGRDLQSQSLTGRTVCHQPPEA